MLPRLTARYDTYSWQLEFFHARSPLWHPQPDLGADPELEVPHREKGAKHNRREKLFRRFFPLTSPLDGPPNGGDVQSRFLPDNNPNGLAPSFHRSTGSRDDR